MLAAAAALALVVAAVTATAWGAGAGAAAAGGTGSYLLTATNTGSTYAPTFTGNGMLGVRVPPTGQGYAAGTVPAQSELAGFYAQPPGGVQQRANTPTWSTLTYSVGGQPFSLANGTTSGWRQSLDLHTGVVTTTARWTAPDGHVTDLSYRLLTDRARQFVGLVRLTLTPQWSGTATVTDAIDGTPAALSTQVSKGWASGPPRDWVSIKTREPASPRRSQANSRRAPTSAPPPPRSIRAPIRALVSSSLSPSPPDRATRSRSTSAWRARIANKIAVLTGPLSGMHPEFAGYRGQLVKQADVTLLQYPRQLQMFAPVARNDINYYVPRTDPTGPSMTDAVNTIDTAALGTPGCASYVYTERSLQPFIRDVFNQFSETKTGGAFTFMTGIGGFLQEFIYGYSGLRWFPAAVQVDPSLTGQLAGVVLHGISWRGRRFTVAIGRRTTTVTLDSGAPLPISTPLGIRSVKAGRTFTMSTRRPDLFASGDLARCAPASATSSQPGAPALAAVDGSPATDWQPVTLPAAITVPLQGGTRTVRTATLRWASYGRPHPPRTCHRHRGR